MLKAYESTLFAPDTCPSTCNLPATPPLANNSRLLPMKPAQGGDQNPTAQDTCHHPRGQLPVVAAQEVRHFGCPLKQKLRVCVTW
jgi:hypothetical protein